jgi:hypothetical protein
MCCIHCGKPYDNRPTRLKTHEAKCEIQHGVEGRDYVRCKLCNIASKSITQHVRRDHGMSKEDYTEKYGSVKCTASTDKYSSANKVNSQWIERAKAEGHDLTEYKVKMSQAVSAAIMSNSVERARRSKMLGDMNRTDEARQRSSNTAKITSARSEIQAQRSANLARWRAENPDEFYEKCTRAAIESPKARTKPELFVHNYLVNIFPERIWDLGKQIKSELFTTRQSRRAQIDILDRENLIAIEIDGPWHFKCELHQGDNPEKSFADRITRDQQLNNVMQILGYCLIRLSYDTWHGRTGIVKPEHMQKLYDLISEAQPGVHFIGERRAGIDVESVSGPTIELQLTEQVAEQSTEQVISPGVKYRHSVHGEFMHRGAYIGGGTGPVVEGSLKGSVAELTFRPERHVEQPTSHVATHHPSCDCSQCFPEFIE